MTMIERIARALSGADADKPREIPIWTRFTHPDGSVSIQGTTHTGNFQPEWKFHVDEARAAVEVMREHDVSPEIMRQLIQRWSVLQGGEGIMRELWAGMIQAILSEK